MAYSTNTTILLLFPGLPQTTTTGGYTETSALIDQHVNRADNVINGKLVKRYAVSAFNTTTSVPPLLKTISEDITSWFTFRSLYASDNQNDNEWVEKFKDAMEILNELRDGEIDLADDSGNIIAERTSSAIDRIESTTENFTPMFDEGNVLDWKLNDTKKTDIESNK